MEKELLLSSVTALVFAVVFILSAKKYVRSKFGAEKMFLSVAAEYLLLFLINFKNRNFLAPLLGIFLFHILVAYAYALYKMYKHNQKIKNYEEKSKNDDFAAKPYSAFIEDEKHKTAIYFKLAYHHLLSQIFFLVFLFSMKSF